MFLKLRLNLIIINLNTHRVICYNNPMKNGRNTDGRFSKGNTGRPKGARNLKTVAIESLLEGQAEALTQTAISSVEGRHGSPASLYGQDHASAKRQLYQSGFAKDY